MSLLYYHKPSLATMPSEDLPDTIPLQLEWEGEMLLGLPLHGAEPEEEQNPAFNAYLAYTVVSWPECQAIDLLEIKWFQTLFYVVAVANLVVLLLLLVGDGVEPSRVEPAGVSGIPGPFQKIQVNETAVIIHFIVPACIGVFGLWSAFRVSAPALSLYLTALVLSFVLMAPTVPNIAFAFRYMIDTASFTLARALRSRASASVSWERASASFSLSRMGTSA